MLSEEAATEGRDAGADDPGDRRALARARGLLTFAALAVMIALSFYNGFLDAASLVAVTAAAAAAVWAALLGRSRAGRPAASARLDTIIWLGALLSVGLNLALPPGYDEDWPNLGAWRPLVAVAGLVVCGYGWKKAPAAFVRLRFWILCLVFAAMAGTVIRGVPDPQIDVLTIRQAAADGLAAGSSPYTHDYPNPNAKASPFLLPSVLSADGQRILWDPYPPLLTVLDLPAAVLGLDVRWMSAVFMIFAAWAIRRLGRGARGAELLAVLLLVQPRAGLVIRQGWTDPAVLACLALFLLALDAWPTDSSAPSASKGARGWLPTGLAAALLATSKQYAPLLLVPLFFAIPVAGRLKATLAGLVGGLVLTLPFVLSSPDGFYRGVVAFQFLTPFRPDALSWLAAVVRLGGPELPPWAAFGLAFGCLAATLRARVTARQALASGGAAFMLLVLFNKQAFCNYYWLAAGIFAFAAALYARAAEEARDAATSAASPAPASNSPATPY